MTEPAPVLVTCDEDLWIVKGLDGVWRISRPWVTSSGRGVLPKLITDREAIWLKAGQKLEITVCERKD